MEEGFRRSQMEQELKHKHELYEMYQTCKDELHCTFSPPPPPPIFRLSGCCSHRGRFSVEGEGKWRSPVCVREQLSGSVQ
jgi:hypothetical protein